MVGTSIVAATALVLAGCSSDASSDATSSPSAVETSASEEIMEPVTISYTNFISNGGNEENLASIVTAFEAENPNITVEVTTLPYDNYGTALQTDIAAGTVSDTFDVEFSSYASLQSNGVLAPIELADPGIYRPSLLDAYSTDGTPYALPSSFSTVVLFYNKDLFDAAGVSYPDGTWNWDDLMTAAESLTDQDAGVWGLHQPVSFYEYYKTVAQNGGEMLNADGTAVAFDSPEGIGAAEWLVDKSGVVMPTIEQGQGTPDFDTNLFKEGKLGMMLTGIWMFGAFADAPFGWDLAVEPGNVTQASAAFSNAVGISEGSENKEAATKWAEFLTASPVAVQTRLDAGWELPPISDQTQLDAYLTAGAPANRQAVFDSLDNIALVPIIGEGQNEMQDIVGEELVEAQAGRKTAAEAIASAAERVNEVLNR